MNTAKQRGLFKLLRGTVVSDKNDKTIIVKVARRVKHPVYGKFITLFKKYTAHDANNDAKVGDIVSIASTRPMSKTKRWRLFRVEERKVG